MKDAKETRVIYDSSSLSLDGNEGSDQHGNLAHPYNGTVSGENTLTASRKSFNRVWYFFQSGAVFTVLTHYFSLADLSDCSSI